MSNVRPLTDKEILDRVKTHAQGFIDYPNNFWMIYVRSKENAFNVFDDKRYLFNGTKFVAVATCTTNAGKYGLKSFAEYNKLGCAVLKADYIVYDYLIDGLHKGKAEAWKQNKPWPYYRDNDGDDLAEEIGKLYYDIIGANAHSSTYVKGSDNVTKLIGSWSTACMVDDDNDKFERDHTLVTETNKQELMTMCILNEW